VCLLFCDIYYIVPRPAYRKTSLVAYRQYIFARWEVQIDGINGLLSFSLSTIFFIPSDSLNLSGQAVSQRQGAVCIRENNDDLRIATPLYSISMTGLSFCGAVGGHDADPSHGENRGYSESRKP
jgi:hypothetical protein